jgi:hypothetical protein
MNHTAALLDITLESAHDYYVVDHVNFTASSCAVNHGCALGGTNRRLLRFSTIGLNIGRQPYKPPVPAWHYPWIYQFNECHGHFHTQNVMRFELLDAVTERSLYRVSKLTYCMEDSVQIPTFQAPNVPCEGHSRCDEQGLQVGWQDTYGPDLDCQFIDVTDLTTRGPFILEQCFNPDRLFQEASFENNCVRELVYL